MPMTMSRLVLALVIGFGASAETQDTNIPTATFITLQRTSCYGPCPIYTVSIDARGTVTYGCHESSPDRSRPRDADG